MLLGGDWSGQEGAQKQESWRSEVRGILYIEEVTVNVPASSGAKNISSFEDILEMRGHKGKYISLYDFLRYKCCTEFE